MRPTFTVITPSLQRESLVRCCESIDAQTYPYWQHVIALDCAQEETDLSLMLRLRHPQNRTVICCGQKFGNYGNHARWMAWEKATEDYLVYCDDDNAMYRPDALADIAKSLEEADFPDFALFPIHRHGSIFLLLPPGLCMTDTANVVVRREIGRWPDIEAREADGHWVEALKEKYEYAAFPSARPIVLMEKSSNGV